MLDLLHSVYHSISCTQSGLCLEDSGAHVCLERCPHGDLGLLFRAAACAPRYRA